MKKKIYIDIDGVLLDDKTGEPAKHAEELIMFLTSGRYDCYWLTTHCKGDTAPTLQYLSGHFSDKVMKRLSRPKRSTLAATSSGLTIIHSRLRSQRLIALIKGLPCARSILREMMSFSMSSVS